VNQQYLAISVPTEKAAPIWRKITEFSFIHSFSFPMFFSWFSSSTPPTPKPPNDILSSIPSFDNLSDLVVESHSPPTQDPLQELLTTHPSLTNYVSIHILSGGPTDTELRALSSPETQFSTLASVSNDIVDTLEYIDNSLNELRRQRLLTKLPDNSTFQFRGLSFLSFSIREKQLLRHQKYILQFQTIKQHLIRLINSGITNPSNRIVVVDVAKLSQDLGSFDSVDPILPRLKKRTTHLSLLIDHSPKTVPQIGIAIETARKRINVTENFFTDTGEPESIFQSLIYPAESVELRLKTVLADPEGIGREVLISATEFVRENELLDNDLPIVFLLFARFYFKRIYELTIGKELFVRNYADISGRVAQLKQLSPAGFGITETFLDERWLAIPLNKFPKENLYSQAIELFEGLPYYICPIDFCVVLRDGLKTIQEIASMHSFQYCSNKGIISGKSDHLLSSDTLADVATVVFLIANPVPTIGVVLAFEPYIHGLEMAADLEFAFISLNLIIKRLLTFDIEKFVLEARAKAEAAVEVDPLLGS
jgi:hypothetical protein